MVSSVKYIEYLRNSFNLEKNDHKNDTSEATFTNIQLPIFNIQFRPVPEHLIPFFQIQQTYKKHYFTQPLHSSLEVEDIVDTQKCRFHQSCRSVSLFEW